MMKKIGAFILLLTVLGSCKDPEPTIEQLLTAPEDGWVFDSVIALNPDTGAQEDLVRNPDVFKPCTLDDGVMFAADGTFTVRTNNKCDPADPEIANSGTWKLSDDKTTLTMVSDLTGKNLIELSALSVGETKFSGETSQIGDLVVLAIVTMRKNGTF